MSCTSFGTSPALTVLSLSRESNERFSSSRRVMFSKSCEHKKTISTIAVTGIIVKCKCLFKKAMIYLCGFADSNYYLGLVCFKRGEIKV